MSMAKPMVNMLEAKSSLSQLVHAVESGAQSEIIIARNGKPAVRLVPLAPKPDTSKRLGLVDGKYPSMSLEEFDANNEEIAKLFYGEDE